MKNHLRIKSERWPEVTDVPDYIVEINYEGISCVHGDIYFDDKEVLVSKLRALENDRKGSVELDGGVRFKILAKAKTVGGITLSFRHESDATFPGKLVLEGYFSVDGENTAQVVEELIGLLTDGNKFAI